MEPAYVILTSKPGVFRTEAGEDVEIIETYDYRFYGRALAEYRIARLRGETRLTVTEETPPYVVNRVVTPDTIIDTNPGYLSLGRYTIRDVPRNNGVLNVTGVITRSSNVGAAKVAAKMPDQTFYDGVRRFGYGSVPHSGFPGESGGALADPEQSALHGLLEIDAAQFGANHSC